LQIGDAKFDLTCIFTHCQYMYDASGRHPQYARNNFDRRMPPSDSFGCSTESDTTQHDTPRGDQERMALRRLHLGVAEQRSSEASNRAPKLAKWPLTISSARLAAACTQVWAIIYWMVMNVEKEHNQPGCTLYLCMRARAHCCMGRHVMASLSYKILMVRGAKP
jgi:hypothetical protein